ncbi:DNA-binding XRE family transcriptional regulator [Chryseobacterium rhizosphaerae]|uniref:helix-turn-helix domain-containing protein n=1 Tax=Chryseobacterium rhizosphaerae TaxID=395937 RepID=UPI002859DACB|nr:helix-turn-helix domain-containing protein [Chryseobacterium rhizosphaerae]MDR6544849.1 DNA-binding XRE family transcriptional regulator [Chryseobacterium rhizosphaerae]
MKTNQPNYKIIYADILEKKYPEKMETCQVLLEKLNLSFIDILELNNRIFGTTQKTKTSNGKFRFYKKSDILEILDYQKKYRLNNSQLALYFGISRVTISKWKKKFI